MLLKAQRRASADANKVQVQKPHRRRVRTQGIDAKMKRQVTEIQHPLTWHVPIIKKSGAYGPSNGAGMGLAWGWHGVGVGLAWGWRGAGMGLAWGWRGVGVGLACVGGRSPPTKICFCPIYYYPFIFEFTAPSSA